MKLPDEVRESFRRYGRAGGRRRAERMAPAARRAVARRAAMVRWTRARFGAASFEQLGLPGGDLVDAGLEALASGRVSPEALAVSLAAPRLRREGVPVGPVLDDPEHGLYDLLAQRDGDLAHARYNAFLRRLVSFADSCRRARLPEARAT
jgi:hypothetical protein